MKFATIILSLSLASFSSAADLSAGDAAAAAARKLGVGGKLVSISTGADGEFLLNGKAKIPDTIIQEGVDQVIIPPTDPPTPARFPPEPTPTLKPTETITITPEPTLETSQEQALAPITPFPTEPPPTKPTLKPTGSPVAETDPPTAKPSTKTPTASPSMKPSTASGKAGKVAKTAEANDLTLQAQETKSRGSSAYISPTLKFIVAFGTLFY